MRKGFLIYEEMGRDLTILNFVIYEDNFIVFLVFYQCGAPSLIRICTRVRTYMQCCGSAFLFSVRDPAFLV
jgi:hypothetical protein